jgi:hypothetical protein
MKEISYYSKVDVPYPNREEIADAIMIEMETFVGTKSEIIAKEEELKVKVKETYFIMKKAYNSGIADKSQEFKFDLFEEYNVLNNPKKDKCFEFAWEYGHSDGYGEIANYFGDLVELIK